MSNQNTVEQALNAYLKKDESICWTGKSEAFPLLDKKVKNQIVGKWICTAVVAIGLILMYVRVVDKAMMDIKLIVGIAAIAVFVMILPVFERYKLLQQRYWLTNRRAIIMKFDGSFKSMLLTEIDEILLVKDKAEHDCLVLGSGAINDVEKNLRWRACNPKVENSVADEEESRDTRGMVFYCVSNAEEAAAWLKKEIAF